MMTASAYVKSTKSSKIDDHVISLVFSKIDTLSNILANEHVKHCRRRFIRTFPSSLALIQALSFCVVRGCENRRNHALRYPPTAGTAHSFALSFVRSSFVRLLTLSLCAVKGGQTSEGDKSGNDFANTNTNMDEKCTRQIGGVIP